MLKMHYTNAAYGQYKRPNRNMFMEHTHDLIHSYHLNSCHIQGYVSDIKQSKQQWHVQLNNKNWISSDHVVVAFGCNHEIYIPELFQLQPDISHILKMNKILIPKHLMSLVVVFCSSPHVKAFKRKQ